MNSIRRCRKAAPIAILFSILLLGACATQRVDLSTVKQGPADAGTNLKHFKASGYTVYMLFDLVPVHQATVESVLADVNPEGKPVVNLKVTSQEDPLACVLNLLNGGAADRGVLVSLNKLTVEGDIVE
jgi:hypothetical protein